MKVRVKLAKDPEDYAVGSKGWRCHLVLQTDGKKGGVTINPEEIDRRKYKEVLMGTVVDALEILGYGSDKK